MKKTNIKKIILTSLLSVFASSASAAAVTLNFEGVANNTAVGNFYNGGAGINYGVQFGTTALARIDSDVIGIAGAPIANEPSPSTVVGFTTLAGVNDSFLNVAAGFDTGFSFFYSASQAKSVSIYDGLNGTGSLLGTLALAAQHNANGCIGDPNGTFCNWSQLGLSFSGIAKSINFTNALNTAAFDNITLGANLAAVPVPEPETYAMMLAGLGLIGFVARRRKEDQA